MANALSVIRQKRGVNFKTLVVACVLSGNYTQVTGESVNLSAASIPNPNAVVATGPNGTPTIPPRVTTQTLGGYKAELTATATPLVYTLRFWNGNAELAAGAYPAVISGGTLVFELDFGTAG